ncbi:UDP-N-acetylglucosamine 2-epimerase [Pseudoxanthomonas beigongshangi]
MEHPRIIAASAIALAVTLFAIFSMRPWARRVGLVDRPDTRKQHNGRVPLIGGICFFIGLLVGLAYLGFIDRFVMSVMMGAALIVAMGVADDVVHLTVQSRLLIESAIVALVILSTGYYIDNLGGLLPGDIRLGIWGIPLTIFAVIGLINAFNMLDGIDGLAASVALVCIGSVLMYDRAGWTAVGAMLMLQVLFAALIPYIFANLGWPDGRKIFMGDAGSMAIGFLLGWSLIYLSHSRVGRLAPVDVLWCVALPVMDTLAVMYRRMRVGRSPFGADRQHLHHLLMDDGFSSRATLALMVAAGMGLALLGYVLRAVPDPLNLLCFIAATVMYVVGLPRLLELRKRGFRWRPSTGVARFVPSRAAVRSMPTGASGEDHEPYPVARDADGNEPLRALCVVAATPEAMGVAPIAQRLADDVRFQTSVCLAEVPGTDGEAALRLFGLEAQERLAGDDGTDALVNGVRELLDQLRPDVVLVPGNGPATFALSLAAHADEVPVVCVDGDASVATPSHWPNEASRRIVQSLAALHVAASEDAGQRLQLEGVPEERVLVQDGIVAESLRTGLDTLRTEPRLGHGIAWRFPFLREDSPLLMVACTADRADAAPLVEALEMIARRRPDVDIVWPREAADAHEASGALHAFGNVHMLELSDYLAWLHLLERAQLVLAGQGSSFPGQLPGKPVLRVCDTPDRDGIAIGTTALAIAGRVLTLLSEPAIYQSLTTATTAGARDGLPGGDVPDALVRLRSGNHESQPREADDIRYAYGVREAS